VPQQKLILADEPTGNLDPDLSAEIMKLFEQFQKTGITVLIVSHDISLISRLNHRVLTLEHGELISDKRPC
jgi:cell division transport system ATP-binding protein